MTNHKRTQAAALIFIGILIIGIAFFWRWPLFMGSSSKEYTSVATHVVGLQSYKGPVAIKLLSKENGQRNDYRLELTPLIGRLKTIELPGFEKEIIFLESEKFGGADYLFFEGAVGVHSKNLVVVKIDNQELSIMRFEKDKQADISLVSDWPKFEIKNFGSLDIKAFYRDYEKDPLTDSFTKNYKIQGDRFNNY